MLSLDFQSLRQIYAAGCLAPSQVIEAIYDRIEARGDDGVWILVVPRDSALQRACALEALDDADKRKRPLFGLPFSIKDCIDVAGMPTTAGCPGFAYTATKTNLAVQRAMDAGAILIGKTNLDQFATGLVGVRTPYGVAENPFNRDYIPGGSSSGAAVSVASELVSFAFGTDTGGSGRVPAGFNNIVSLKPTLGLLSRVDMVNACRSLDTIAIFALTAPDALEVLDICAARDPADVFARTPPAVPARTSCDRGPFTFAAPRADQRQFFGNADAQALFDEALRELARMGGRATEVDYEAFLEVNEFLFNGPWLAERLVSLKSFIRDNPQAIHPVTREIILGGAAYSAADMVAGVHRLKELRGRISRQFDGIDVLVVPTAGTIYRVREIEADPITLNAGMGYYTNFVNLLDMAAVTVPNGFLSNGLPMGVTFIGRAFSDGYLAALGGAYHGRRVSRLGATDFPVPEPREFGVAAH